MDISLPDIAIQRIKTKYVLSFEKGEDTEKAQKDKAKSAVLHSAKQHSVSSSLMRSDVNIKFFRTEKLLSAISVSTVKILSFSVWKICRKQSNSLNFHLIFRISIFWSVILNNKFHIPDIKKEPPYLFRYYGSHKKQHSRSVLPHFRCAVAVFSCVLILCRNMVLSAHITHPNAQKHEFQFFCVTLFLPVWNPAYR